MSKEKRVYIAALQIGYNENNAGVLIFPETLRIDSAGGDLVVDVWNRDDKAHRWIEVRYLHEYRPLAALSEHALVQRYERQFEVELIPESTKLASQFMRELAWNVHGNYK